MNSSSDRFLDLPSQPRYVGYVDLLGFSRLVQTDFERARGVYNEILSKASLLDSDGRWQVHPAHVEITAASDSFIVVGEDLQNVANWCSGLFVGALRAHVLARGSIAYGRHVQQNVHSKGTSRHHTLIVSEALVLAAADERARKMPPCGITLQHSIPKEAIQGLDGQAQLATQRSILFKDGRWVTNPFTAGILRWIEDPIKRLLHEYRGTVHQPKYEWLLALFTDVRDNKPLRPEPATE